MNNVDKQYLHLAEEIIRFGDEKDTRAGMSALQRGVVNILLKPLALFTMCQGLQILIATVRNDHIIL
jgi:hypothetical protein